MIEKQKRRGHIKCATFFFRRLNRILGVIRKREKKRECVEGKVLIHLSSLKIIV